MIPVVPTLERRHLCHKHQIRNQEQLTTYFVGILIHLSTLHSELKNVWVFDIGNAFTIGTICSTPCSKKEVSRIYVMADMIRVNIEIY